MTYNEKVEKLICKLIKTLPIDYKLTIEDKIYNYTNKEKGIGTVNYVALTIRDNIIEYCDFIYNIVDNKIYKDSYLDYTYREISLIKVIEKLTTQKILHELWSSIQNKLDKYNYNIEQLEEFIYGRDKNSKVYK